jgi:glycosyltransferase involved in cell wall biosynthesis
VLGQSYKDLELIVIDDASTDDTQEIVKKLTDARVRYILHHKNCGAGAARNTGIRAAQGIYVAFQDSDDEWLPQKLERQIQRLKAASPDTAVVYTAFLRHQVDKVVYIPKASVKNKNGYIHKELIKGNFIGTPTMLVPKDLLFKVGLFDEKLPRLQDWDLVIRLSKLYQFFYIDEPLVNVYRTRDSLSEDKKGLEVALRQILEKRYSSSPDEAEAVSICLLNFGSRMVSYGSVREGRMYLAKSFKKYPNITSLLALSLSLAGSCVYRNITEIFIDTYQFLIMWYRNLNSKDP